MTFDPSNYQDTILIAGGDYSADFFSQGHAPPPLWERANLDQPDIVRSCAVRFLQAGADILVTPTDRANEVALAEMSASGEISRQQITAINRQGAMLCRQAVAACGQSSAKVFGGVGPVELLLSLGEIKEDVLFAAYAAQVEALADGGVDAILCRGFTEIQALCIAVEAAQKNVSPDLSVVGSMVFDCGADFTETAMGVTVPQACQGLVQAGATIVGCDHGEYPDAAASVVTLLRASCDLPIWAEINAGQPELRDGRAVYLEPPEQFGTRLEALAASGASFIGGAGGATAQHVAALSQARRRYLEKVRRRG